MYQGVFLLLVALERLVGLACVVAVLVAAAAGLLLHELVHLRPLITD